MFQTSSFIPVLQSTYQLIDGYDRFSQPLFSAPISFGLSVVKLDLTLQSTSIRTDKSGSKSFADETTVNGRILSNMPIPEGSKVALANQVFRSVGLFPRYDMDGTVNHWQVDLALWRDQ